MTHDVEEQENEKVVIAQTPADKASDLGDLVPLSADEVIVSETHSDRREELLATIEESAVTQQRDDRSALLDSLSSTADIDESEVAGSDTPAVEDGADAEQKETVVDNKKELLEKLLDIDDDEYNDRGEDISRYFAMHIGTAEELVDMWADEFAKFTTPEDRQVAQQLSPKLIALAQAHASTDVDLENNMMHNVALNLRRLRKFSTTQFFKDNFMADDRFRSKTSRILGKLPATKPGEPVVFRGEQAANRLAARMSGVVRVRLIGSGFWVNVVSPSLPALGDFYQKVSSDMTELGRLLGGHYLSIRNTALTDLVLDIFESIVIDTNLTGADKHGRIKNNIAITDVDIIYNELVALMHPKGIVDYRVTCGGCKRAFKVKQMDYRSLMLPNTGAVDPDALSRTYGLKEIGPAGLQAYRELNAAHLGNKIVDGDTTIELRIPLANDVIRNNMSIIAGIQRGMRDDIGSSIPETDRIANGQVVRMNRVYAPFIVRVIDMEDGQPVIYEGEEAVYTFLEHARKNGRTAIFQKLAAFVQKSTSCVTGIYNHKCPSCGHKHPEEFSPIDPQQTFYSVCSRRVSLAAKYTFQQSQGN